jgi:hypothetical protein
VLGWARIILNRESEGSNRWKAQSSENIFVVENIEKCVLTFFHSFIGACAARARAKVLTRARANARASASAKSKARSISKARPRQVIASELE